MSEAEEIWPDEGELLVCTVKGVKENGAYLNLGGYGDKEGFVFIGEVASGWVKNIRAHLREGQRVVAKVVTIKKDCLLYTSPSPRDLSTSRMPSSA